MLNYYGKHHDTYDFLIGLDCPGHISFLAEQDRICKSDGQVLPEPTKSGKENVRFLDSQDFDCLVV